MKKVKSDGSTASYYVIPGECNTLGDIVELKKMPQGIAEAFLLCATYGEMPSHTPARDVSCKFATELQDIISASDMNGQLAEIFRACMRFGEVDHSNELRDVKKIIFYNNAEINRIHDLIDNGVPSRQEFLLLIQLAHCSRISHCAYMTLAELTLGVDVSPQSPNPPVETKIGVVLNEGKALDAGGGLSTTAVLEGFKRLKIRGGIVNSDVQPAVWDGSIGSCGLCHSSLHRGALSNIDGCLNPECLNYWENNHNVAPEPVMPENTSAGEGEVDKVETQIPTNREMPKNIKGR
ncbi:MAG: hypothetical protein JRJ45_00275 [Deltaproteobacteria bacterium]|nr:hypothetical protein [Deltaproteobacteria bacterium]